VNILARGPAAVNAYQQACNEPRGNARLASRIRAVIVGQDSKERARLKRHLSSSDRFETFLIGFVRVCVLIWTLECALFP
jgi:hypothetical protein